jgi:large subunit ribosomal protein L29
MKAAELRNMTRDELQAKLKEYQRELFNLRFQVATGQLKNFNRIKDVKKDIARILTVLREMELEEARAEAQ